MPKKLLIAGAATGGQWVFVTREHGGYEFTFDDVAPRQRVG